MHSVFLLERVTTCEIYTRQDGHLAIRFKPGMDLDSTKALSGTTKYSGAVVPTPVAVLDHLSNSCKTSDQCDDSYPYEMTISYLEPDGRLGDSPTDKRLSIAGSGSYPSGIRNALVKAIQETAGADGVIEWHRGIHWTAARRRMAKRETAGIARPSGHENCDCGLAELSTHIGLNVFKGDGNMVATMEAKIEIDSEDGSGDFSDAKTGLDITSSIAGALGPWIGAVGGDLGVVKAQ